MIFRHFLFLFLFLFFSCTERRLLFDSVVWKQSRHCKPIEAADKRLLMLSDLETNILPNKTKNELIALLGDSLPSNVLKSIKRDLLYCLGRDYGMTMKWLVINFDLSGKASWEIISGD